MPAIDNSIKNLLSNVLDITREDRQTAITAMIQNRQDEIRCLTKEIFWLKQLNNLESRKIS